MKPQVPGEATLQRIDVGQWGVRGDLGIHTVGGLLENLDALLDEGHPTTVDFSHVDSIDSGALAFMLEMKRRCAAHGTEIRFVNIPAKLRSIAEVCGVFTILSS